MALLCIMFLVGATFLSFQVFIREGREGEDREGQADTFLTSSCAGIQRGLLEGAPETGAWLSSRWTAHSSPQPKSCEKQGGEKGGQAALPRSAVRISFATD